MFKHNTVWPWIILALVLLGVRSSPALAHNIQSTSGESSILREVGELMPLSVQMLDEAVLVLSEGWSDLSPSDREWFERIFDPADTGEIDQAFVERVLVNYGKIRRRLEGQVDFEYVPDSDKCCLMRLYYTDLFKIYVCPYFGKEADRSRKARGLIHEVAHRAMLVRDRPYFDPSHSTRYNALTPVGPWTAEIPLVGPIFREISASDTLYHPDTYAWFAEAMGLAHNGPLRNNKQFSEFE